MKNPFHLAIPVNDLAKATDFYEKTLGVREAEQVILGLILTYSAIN